MRHIQYCHNVTDGFFLFLGTDVADEDNLQAEQMKKKCTQQAGFSEVRDFY